MSLRSWLHDAILGAFISSLRLLKLLGEILANVHAMKALNVCQNFRLCVLDVFPADETCREDVSGGNFAKDVSVDGDVLEVVDGAEEMGVEVGEGGEARAVVAKFTAGKYGWSWVQILVTAFLNSIQGRFNNFDV